MPSGPELTQFAAIALSVASGVGGLVTQFIEHPSGNYETKVKKLQKDRWSALSTELGELMLEVEDTVDNGDGYDQEDITREAKFSLVIQREYNKDEFSDVLEQIEDVNTPKKLFQSAREARDSTFERFVISLILSIIGFGLVLFLPDTPAAGQLTLLLAGYVFFVALMSARDWRDARQQLDEMWEDYELM